MYKHSLGYRNISTLIGQYNLIKKKILFLENDAEGLERELVDGVDLVQVVEDEVEDGRPRRGWSVQLPGLVDLKGGLLGLGHLHLDVGRGLLRVLQVLDQGGVTEDVVAGRGQPHQQFVL